MSNVWRTLLIIVCCLALALLLWRSPPKELSDLLGTTETPITYPITYLTNIRTRQFTEQGQLSYRLNAEQARYFERSTSTAEGDQLDAVFDLPRLQIFPDDSTSLPWYVSSRLAEGSQTEDELLLSGTVIVEQTRPDGSITRLATETLLLRLERRYAETDKPVIITDPTGTTRATGLKLYFDNEKIELLSKVKGQYDAP